MLRRNNLLSPVWVGFFAGILLSLIIIAQYPGFNRDGVLYLRAAMIFQSEGFRQTIVAYSWPFYPILISCISSLFHLSVLSAAYVLNCLFFAASVSIFIKIAEVLGGNRTIQWTALLIILFYRSFNKFNYFVIRDHGYWCFMLLSILMLLQFMQHATWYKAILWSLCIVVATLFRIEGFIFLFLTPFCVLFAKTSWRLRLLGFLKLNTIPIIIALISLSVLILHPAIFQTDRLSELRFELFHGLEHAFNQFHFYCDQMRKYVLPDTAQHIAAGLLFSGITTYYFYLLLGVVSLPLTILIIYTWYKRVTFLPNQLTVVVTYIVINFLINYVFSFTKLFFTDRYLQMLALSLVLFAPFGFIKLYQDVINDSKSKLKKLLLAIVLFSWLAMVISSLFHIGPSKKYIQTASAWIEQNTLAKDLIFTNIGQIGFMTNRHTTGWECDYGVRFATNCTNWATTDDASLWHDAQYIVLDLPQDQTVINHVIQIMHHSPIQVFTQNRPKRQVMIFNN